MPIWKMYLDIIYMRSSEFNTPHQTHTCLLLYACKVYGVKCYFIFLLLFYVLGYLCTLLFFVNRETLKFDFIVFLDAFLIISVIYRLILKTAIQ